MAFDSGNISESLLKYVMDGTCESTVERYASLKDAAAQADYGAFDHDPVSYTHLTLPTIIAV